MSWPVKGENHPALPARITELTGRKERCPRNAATQLQPPSPAYYYIIRPLLPPHVPHTGSSWAPWLCYLSAFAHAVFPAWNIFSPPHPLSGCFSAFLTLNPRQAPSVCLSIFVLDSLTACAVISNQSQFSLLTVVMFSEAAMNTKLANTEPLLLKGKRVGFCKPLVTFLSTDQYLTLFDVCFCFKTPYLTYIADSLTLNSWPVLLQLRPEQSLSNTHFPHKAQHGLLGLGNTR